MTMKPVAYWDRYIRDAIREAHCYYIYIDPENKASSGFREYKYLLVEFIVCDSRNPACFFYSIWNYVRPCICCHQHWFARCMDTCVFTHRVPSTDQQDRWLRIFILSGDYFAWLFRIQTQMTRKLLRSPVALLMMYQNDRRELESWVSDTSALARDE